jgi:hypothetical protein
MPSGCAGSHIWHTFEPFCSAPVGDAADDAPVEEEP